MTIIKAVPSSSSSGVSTNAFYSNKLKSQLEPYKNSGVVARMSTGNRGGGRGNKRGRGRGGRGRAPAKRPEPGESQNL